MSPRLIAAPGVAVFIPNARGTEHLVAIIAAVSTTGDIALVSVTTDRKTRQTDRACFLDDQDHPFLRHRSYALYAEAFISTVAQLQQQLDAGAIRLAATFEASVTARLAQGAITSPRTPRGVRDFVKEHR